MPRKQFQETTSSADSSTVILSHFVFPVHFYPFYAVKKNASYTLLLELSFELYCIELDWE